MLRLSPASLALFALLAAPCSLHAQTAQITPFVTRVVDGTGDVGVGIAGAVDYFMPQVAYYDATSKDLKYASMVEGIDHRFAPQWVIEVVDGIGTDVGEYPSLALDAQGRPHLSYYNATTGDLMYATRQGAGCPWVIETVDNGGTGNVGLHTSIAVSSGTSGSGPSTPEVAILFLDASNGTLKYSKKSGSGPWVIENVDIVGFDFGLTISVALDSENRPHVAYYDAIGGDLKYAVKLGVTLPWTIEVVDGLSLDVGRYASIALAPAGPMISYYDSSNHDLKVATRLTTGWLPVTVDVTGDVGLDTSLEIEIDTGEPIVTYYDASNGDLRLARRSATTWTVETVATLGLNGRYCSLSLDPYGNPIVLYYDADNGDLKIADSSIRLELPQTVTIDPGSKLEVRWSGKGPLRIELEIEDQRLEVAVDVSEPATTISVPNMVTEHARLVLIRNTPHSESRSKGSITIAPTGLGDRWSRALVDGSNTDTGGYTSLALDANGSPRIAYYDFIDFDLKYARKVGATWAVETVDATGDVGAYCSLALDPSGNPQIAYYDYTNGDLKFATKSGSTWTIEVVDGGGTLGPDVGWYASLVGEGLGDPDTRAIAYYDATNGDLKLATKSGSTWTTEVVDGASGDVGWFISAVRGHVGPPFIAYYDATNGDLKFASKPGATWAIEVVDVAGDVGRYASLVSTPVTPPEVATIVGPPERPMIAYHDLTNGNLKFAYKVEDGVWSTQTVHATGTVGRHNSLTVDARGRPHIAYRDVTNGILKLASAVGAVNPEFNQAGVIDPNYISWHIETIDASGDVGGWTSLTMDPYQNLRLSYRDITNGDLRYASTAVEVGEPAEGTVWPVGASRSISWDGSGPVDVSLSTDGGAHWDLIAEALNLGLHKGEVFRTIVPHAPTHFAQIKVERAIPHSVSITPGLFTIETSIALLALLAAPAPGKSGAVVTWSTDPGPADLAGYRLDRASAGSDWLTVLALTREVSYADPTAGPATRYRLFAVNGFGEELLVGETSFRPAAPLAAWPVPYRGGNLSIAFATYGGLGGGPGPAEVSLYDVSGRLVRTLARGTFPAGYQDAVWDGLDGRGRKAAAGVYFIRSSSAGTERTLKVVIAR